MGKDVLTKDINLTKFLDARSGELAYFEEKVRTKFMTINRTPMQSVPKHMRRRAMSHNRFRIPSRLRAIHDKIMKGNEKKKLRCRKHMRNSKLLLLHYFKRSFMQNPGLETGLKNSALDCKEFVGNNLGKKKWLETHLWHARRMKMEIYCGYKIAIKSYQKQIKAVCSGMKNGSVIYDKSYYCLLEIVCKSDVQLNQLLVRLNAIGAGQSIGEKIISFQLDKNTDKLLAIKSSELSCVIIANPWLKEYLNDSIFSEAAIAGMNISLNDLTDLINVFELNGPVCLQKVGQVLAAINVGESNGLLKLISQFEGTPANYLPPNLLCTFQCQYTSTKRDLQPPIALQNLVNSPVALQNNQFAELVHYMQTHKMNALAENLFEFFKFGKSLDHHNFLGRFLEGTRGRYTHKTNKKNYDTPKEELTVRPIEPMEEEYLPPSNQNKREAINTHEEEWHKSDISLSKRIRSEELKPFPVLLANLSSRKEGHDRLLLLVPSGFGKKIWRQLFIKGTKAAARLEYEHALHQLENRVFPQDYPHSRFFTQFEQEQHNQAFDAFLRRPPAKRVNYVKIGSPFPFSFNFKEILNSADLVPTGTEFMTHEMIMSYYVNRNLRMLRNRVPKSWGYIYFPTEEDFVSLVKQYATTNMTEDGLMNGKHGEVICLQPNIPKPGKTKNRDEYMQQLAGIEPNSPRELIGRVTSGFLKYGSGKGEGYCTVLQVKVEALEEITEQFSKLQGSKYLHLKKGEALVLMRNTQGVHYHFAILSTN